MPQYTSFVLKFRGIHIQDKQKSNCFKLAMISFPHEKGILFLFGWLNESLYCQPSIWFLLQYVQHSFTYDRKSRKYVYGNINTLSPGHKID